VRAANDEAVVVVGRLGTVRAHVLEQHGQRIALVDHHVMNVDTVGWLWSTPAPVFEPAANEPEFFGPRNGWVSIQQAIVAAALGAILAAGARAAIWLLSVLGWVTA
jgi:hypothetical protein